MLEVIIDFSIIFIGVFVSLIIHEFGHLIGGLLSKYEFHSFTVSLLFFHKKDGKIKFKLRKPKIINLFGGQCWMIPSQDFHHFTPFWINVSGSLFNLLIALILFIVRSSIDFNSSTLSWVIHSQMILNSTVGLFNLIPSRMFGQQSDGYNIIRGFYPTDRRSMYVLLTIDRELKRGKRLRDFEPSLFEVELDEKMDRFYVAYLVMMHAFYLMDKEEHRVGIRELDRLDLKLLPYEWQCVVKCEILYYYLVYCFNVKKSQELYEDKDFQNFLQRKDALPKRVMATYTRLIVGNKNEGERLMNEATALAHKLEGGYKVMEFDKIREFRSYQDHL